MALQASDLALRSGLRVEVQGSHWSLWAWAGKDLCLLTQCRLPRPTAGYPSSPLLPGPQLSPPPSQSGLPLSLTLAVLPGAWVVPECVSAPAGYNQMLIIPAGATSIRVEEVAASRNFLGECGLG